jgi:hypothetical protein
MRYYSVEVDVSQYNSLVTKYDFYAPLLQAWSQSRRHVFLRNASAAWYDDDELGMQPVAMIHN